MRHPQAMAAILGSALALVVSACAPAGPEATETPTATTGATETPTATTGATGGDGGEAAATVEIQGIAFLTEEVTISAGETVTWINNNSAGHTVTHGEDGEAAPDALFDMPIGVGESVSHTFEEPGTYPVTCTIHPQMNMTVIVE